MPTYQYACTAADCGREFERVQSFTDPAVSQCPVCGGLVRKVFSAVGVVFKGSGFYRNDSRSSAAKETASTGSKASESSSSGESSTPSTAPAKSDTSSGSSNGGAPVSTPAAAASA